MELKDNPLLKPENYLEGYNESMQDFKNRPEIVAFDKLCYEVFAANEMGEKFLEYVTERFLINNQVTLGSPTYQIDVIWQEGYRDAYRFILAHVQSHKQRIMAGKK